MKKNILIFAAFVLISVGGFSACEEKEGTLKEQVCDVNNPLIDLPWLKKIVDDFENAEEYRQHARIYQCAYKDGIGFLLELCVGCPDHGYLLTSCTGESLCTLWGIAGNPCKDFDIDFENKELIWEINN